MKAEKKPYNVSVIQNKTGIPHVYTVWECFDILHAIKAVQDAGYLDDAQLVSVEPM